MQCNSFVKKTSQNIFLNEYYITVNNVYLIVIVKLSHKDRHNRFSYPILWMRKVRIGEVLSQLKELRLIQSSDSWSSPFTKL